MRVALVSDWYLPRVGGVELHLRDLAAELQDRGHEVHVLTSTPADPGRQGRLQSADEPSDPPGVRVHRLPVPLVPGLGVTFSPRASAAVRSVLRERRIDVAHVHASIGSTLALAGAHGARAVGVPRVVTFHSVLTGYHWLLRGFDRVFGWSRWPDAFTAVSDAVARDVAAVVPGADVEVLPNGLDVEAWRSVRPVAGDAHDLRLVSVLRLQPRKRGRALLDVVARAARRLEGTRRVSLTVVGEGPERARLEARARRPDLEGRVEFTGYLPRRDVRRVFARSDAFVLVSVLESFGLSALEARAAGLAVVVRGDSGMGERFEQGREALLAGTDEGVVEHLVRLGREPALLERLRDHNRSVAPAAGWPEVVERHLALYERVRAGSGRSVGGGEPPRSVA